MSYELRRFATEEPLPSNVEIGDGCVLEVRRETFAHFRSRRRPGLRLGDRVEVHVWTSFGVEEAGLVEVGDDSILVGASIMCADRVTIGRGVVVSYNVVIADSDFHPLDPIERRRDAVALAPGQPRPRPQLSTSPVVIEDAALIGIGAILLKGVTVGSGARVGAGSVVTSDVRPRDVVAGNPARPVPHARASPSR